MASPIFETRNSQPDSIGEMEIYPVGRGALDISDDAIRRIEGLEKTTSNPTKRIVPDILLTQLHPDQRERVVSENLHVPEFNSIDPERDGLEDFVMGPTSVGKEFVTSASTERNTTDLQLEDMALQAFYDGRNDLAIKYFSEIKDRSAVYLQMETVISQMVANRDFEDALRLAELIIDTVEREKELVYIKAEQKRYAPTGTGDLEDGDREALEADFGAFPKKEEGRVVNLKIIREPDHIEADEEKLNMSPDAPSAVDIAMRKTDNLVDTKTVPPEVPPVVESGATNPPNQPELGVRNENMEANFEALREARDAYATAYAEWEYQTRNSTKLWKKTMFALGASKPAPERLTLRTSTLEDAREEYLKARVACGKATSNTYKENYERITEEELLLQDAIQKARESREASDAENKKMADEMLSKGSVDKVMDKMADTSFGKMLRRANNVWLKVPGKTIMFSTTLVAGGTLFAGAGLGGAAFVGGMRVARAGASILGSQLAGIGLGKYFDKKNETADELNTREYAGAINEKNFAEWEAKKLQQFENNRNLKRRQNAIKVGAMVSVGGATALSSGSILNSIFGTPSVEGVVGTVTEQQQVEKPVLESVSKFNNIVEPKAAVFEANTDVTPSDFDSQIHALKSDILSKYHGEQVPLEVQKNILDVPTDKLLERFQLVDNAHNASAGNVGGRIAYENGKVVYEQAGIKTDLYDPNSEIGSKQFSKIVIGDPSIEIKPTVHEELLGDPVTTADELKPTDPSFGTTEIQSQEPVLVDESKIDISGEDSVKMGETILEQSFEGGKISLIHGTPTDPNHISMVLNGKEFAVGVVKNGITKFVIHPELKGGWFTTTVYERAYDVMQKKISAEAVRIK